MRWLVAAWIGTALLATATLGIVGVNAGPLPEWGHIVGHLGLCGGLAALICGAVTGQPLRRAGLGLAGAFLFGVGIEVFQLPYRPRPSDVGFDLAMDIVGAAIGVAAWAWLRAERWEAVGHLLSVVLHPLWVAPIGLAAVVFAAQRSVVHAAQWTVIGAVCLAPAIGWWVAGIVGRWWTDPDVSRRTDRRTLYLVGCVGMALFEVLAWRGPPPMPDLAAGTLVGTALGTVITVSGLKVSGHVAIPAMLGFVMAESSIWGPVPLLGVALVLSWARVAAGRHRVVEVVAGWGLAGVSAWLVGTLG